MYLKYVVVVLFFLGISIADEDVVFQRFKRNSHKDSVNKGNSGYDNSRNMKEMMDKLDRMDDKLNKLEAHMVNTSKTLNYWTETAGLDDHNYWKEITSCGGVIETTSGRIIGSSHRSDDTVYVECLWTVNAGRRSKIKVNLRRPTTIATSTSAYSSYSSSYSSTTQEKMTQCKIVELKHNYGNSSEIPVYTITSIDLDKTYLFRGPVLYLSCYCLRNPKVVFVEFEGMGPKVYSQVDFQHVNTKNVSGVYDVVTELSKGESQLRDKDVSFITITLPGIYHDSNAPSEDVLLQSLSPDFCKSSSLTLQIDAAHPNTTSLIDCCKIDCLKHKFLVFNGYTIITISVNLSTMMERSSSSSSDYAKLSWDMHRHSNITVALETECGGIVSGRPSAKFSQTYSRYRANSRCVWVIHPFPKTEITVTFLQFTVEEHHDKLFAVGLDDDGEIIETTRFTDDTDVYNLTGRVILIVFYSDSSLQLSGFSLQWKAIDFPSPPDLGIYTKSDAIQRYTDKNGTGKWDIKTPPSWPGLQIGLINHYSSFEPYSTDLSLAYDVNGAATFKLYGSTNGTFDLLLNGTTAKNFNSANYTSQDGIFLLVGRVYNPQDTLSLDFEYNRGKLIVPTSYSGCGGKIVGQHARINFKAGTSIGLNTRCVWLVECQYSSVSFHLIKSGFNKYGVISINTIDTATGKISNHTNRIDNTTGDVLVSGPLILITATTSIYSITGFELEYTGAGESLDTDTDKNYYTRHTTARTSTFDYPMESIVPSSSDTYVFAQNPDGLSTILSSDKLSVQFLSHAMTNNSLGQGYKFILYSFAIFNSSRPLEPAVECTIVTGDLESECQFLRNFTNSDFNSKSETFDIKFDRSAFLFIVKPLEATDGLSTREFELTWNMGGCGGLLGTLPNGKIEYKLLETYSSGEDCIWLVDGSKFGATSIYFSLDQSGVLDRDYLYVYPVQSIGNIGTGKRMKYELGYSSYITATRNVTVPSGVAIVVFRSTSLYYSTYGRGFKISYTMRKTRTINKTPTWPPGKTYVFHQNPQINSEIQLPFTKKMSSLNHNDTVIIYFNSQGSSVSTNRLNISIEDLNLYVNNKTCVSDSLYFYYYSYASFSLKDSYRSYKNPEATCNETITTSVALEDEVPDDAYAEDPIYEDITTATVSRTTVVKTTCNPQCYQTDVLKGVTPVTRYFQISTPFMVIYKSNSDNEVGKKIKFGWKQATTTIPDY